MKQFIPIAATAFALCAVQGYAQESSTTIGGYGSFDFTRTDNSVIANGAGAGAGSMASLNSPRIVLYFSHDFNDWISFYSEFEIENIHIAGDKPAGEAGWEQFYLNFALSKPFNVRAGLVLVPVGAINLRHEPPSFNGVTRPLFDEIVIPTTWRDIGAGVYGAIADGWDYQAYLMGSEDGSKITHDEALADVSNEGQFTNPNHLAVTGRVECTAVKGLTAGLAFYYGGTMDTIGYSSGGVFANPMFMGEFDAMYNIGNLYLRGEFADASISADAINSVYHSAVDSAGQRIYDTPNLVAKGIGGFWVEAAYNVLPWFNTNTPAQVLAFARYEDFDLNQSLAAHAVQDDGLVYHIVTAGLTYKPIYNICVKLDWQSQRTKAYGNSEEGAAALTNIDAGIGWMF